MALEALSGYVSWLCRLWAMGHGASDSVFLSSVTSSLRWADSCDELWRLWRASGLVGRVLRTVPGSINSRLLLVLFFLASRTGRNGFHGLLKTLADVDKFISCAWFEQKPSHLWRIWVFLLKTSARSYGHGILLKEPAQIAPYGILVTLTTSRIRWVF